jgi:Family of unknown function (DUF6188)
VARTDPPLWGPLPVEGYRLTGIEFWTGDVTLEASETTGPGRIRLGWGGPVEVTRPDGSGFTVQPGGRWQEKTDLLALQDATIASLTVDAGSNLALRTADGWRLEIAAGPTEAWELDGPGEGENASPAPGAASRLCGPDPLSVEERCRGLTRNSRVLGPSVTWRISVTETTSCLSRLHAARSTRRLGRRLRPRPVRVVGVASRRAA